MHTLICVTFSLHPAVGGWLRLLPVALPGIFCLSFRDSWAQFVGFQDFNKKKVVFCYVYIFDGLLGLLGSIFSWKPSIAEPRAMRREGCRIF